MNEAQAPSRTGPLFHKSVYHSKINTCQFFTNLGKFIISLHTKMLPVTFKCQCHVSSYWIHSSCEMSSHDAMKDLYRTMAEGRAGTSKSPMSGQVWTHIELSPDPRNTVSEPLSWHCAHFTVYKTHLCASYYSPRRTNTMYGTWN